MIIIFARVRFWYVSDSEFAHPTGLTRSPVRANRGRAPTPSNHASHPSFDRITDMVNNALVDAPQSHARAKQHVNLVPFAINSRSLC